MNKSALCLLLVAASQAHAQQGQSMEERLRTQLRAVTAQLQEAQNEVAALKAGSTSAKPASTPDSSARELAELKAQLAAERRARQQGTAAQQQSQAAVSRASQQVEQYRTAYDGLLKMARASEAERQRLAGEEQQRVQALAMCAEKNVKLYETGQQILKAYESIDLATLVTTRQPFATQSRVKYEQIAQEYGDTLYAGRFDAQTASQVQTQAQPPSPAPAKP